MSPSRRLSPVKFLLTCTWGINCVYCLQSPWFSLLCMMYLLILKYDIFIVFPTKYTLLFLLLRQNLVVPSLACNLLQWTLGTMVFWAVLDGLQTKTLSFWRYFTYNIVHRWGMPLYMACCIYDVYIWCVYMMYIKITYNIVHRWGITWLAVPHSICSNDIELNHRSSHQSFHATRELQC